MNIKPLILLTTLITISIFLLNNQSKKQLHQFQQWKTSYGIHYDNQFEDAFRLKIFIENKEKVNKHNSNQIKTYQMGINQFSALSQQEFQQIYLTLIVHKDYKQVDFQESYTVGDVDWREHGAVTPIKNQGQCGSCWAFSTTGGLQGLYKLIHGQLISFSQSHLMDCSTSYGNKGCEGGLITKAYKFVTQHGIMTEQAYPYIPKQQNCQKEDGPYKFSNYFQVPYCTGLANSITARPISVGVDATNWSPYKSGVFNNCKSNINHGVTLIGTFNGNWVVKNSWSSNWGDNGYITLANGNTCGICTMAAYPVR